MFWNRRKKIKPDMDNILNDFIQAMYKKTMQRLDVKDGDLRHKGEITQLKDEKLIAEQALISCKTINERLRNKIRRLETTTMPTYDEYIEMLSDNRATGPICEGCHRM